jgi:dipeptidyl aminopeptidase/acylaminoacyl peptidase
MAWLPDGAGLAVVVAGEPTAAAWYDCRLARLDLQSGEVTTLYAPPAGRQVARPAPSPDGELVAFVSCSWSDPGIAGGDLWIVPAAGGAAQPARNLTEGVTFSINSAAWLPDGRTLLYDAFDDNQTSIGLVRLDGGADEPGWQRLWRAPCGLGYAGLNAAFPTGPDAGSGEALFAVVRDDAREPGDVWLGRLADGALDWRRLTDLHGEARSALVAGYEDVRWTANDGLAIGGLLMRPAGTTGPAPLVVIVHGGPTAMAGPRFLTRGMAALAPLLTARGIAVLLPNYRGSNGRGVAFAEANRGDMGGADFTDILVGVDHLIATGVADPARLGIGGWSYGGFMTMWSVTQTDRFAAAVAGAGIANWVSFHGGSILHTWDRIFYAADPYDRAGIYVQRSPVFAIDAVRTPTLVLHGDADRDVPADQGREFFRALKDRGVETQLVLYPGAAHGPQEPRHIRDVIERSLAWFTDRLG